MSLKIEMTQVARLAPNLLLDSADLVRDYVASMLTPEGLFQDRNGQPDYYYTTFGLLCLDALQMDIPATTLSSTLQDAPHPVDLIEASTLARCWSYADQSPPEAFHDAIQQICTSCTRNHSFVTSADARTPTVYAAFLATGMHQDLELELSDTIKLPAFLESVRGADGGYPNEHGIPLSTTPSTAAALALYRSLAMDPPKAALDWLLSRFSPEGGVFAADGAPMPDLLSTAVSLHALNGSDVALEPHREPTLDYVDSLWTNKGGFYGNWTENILDVEYTYYGLLALGHLSVL